MDETHIKKLPTSTKHSNGLYLQMSLEADPIVLNVGSLYKYSNSQKGPAGKGKPHMVLVIHFQVFLEFSLDIA